MSDFNKVILVGNLTGDPKSRSVNVGAKSTTVTNFGLAVSRNFKKASGDWGKEVTFVDCEAWDTGAEALAKLEKGQKILIEGALKLDTWEKDGQRFSKLRVRVSSFTRMSSGSSEKVSTDDTTTDAQDPSAEEPTPF